MSEQAAGQVQGIAADLGPGPQASPADVGAAMQAGGASASEVDVAQLLAMIRAQQETLDRLTAERQQELAPPLVTLARAVGDHLAAKAAANPVLAQHPEHPLSEGVGLAGTLAEHASALAQGQAC